LKNEHLLKDICAVMVLVPSRRPWGDRHCFYTGVPLLLTLMTLAGYDLKAFERKYMNWLFFGEFKDE
jgi:hypothetical protein